jgi:heme exporter protein D
MPDLKKFFTEKGQITFWNWVVLTLTILPLLALVIYGLYELVLILFSA